MIEEIQPRSPARLRDRHITMSHGAGGKASMSLIEGIFMTALGNPALDRMDDQALLDVDGVRLSFTTDSYVVDPLFFPGGDIGTLAVNGTVNDLSTCGAVPLYLSLGVILEEGFPVDDLRRVVRSIDAASRAAGVAVVTGDTKVVPRGRADKLYLNTAGVGVLRRGVELSMRRARPGDRVLVSGTVGDHGVTVMAARGDLELDLDLASDCAPLHGLVAAVLDATPRVHCFKDPTRGGVATSLNEIARQSGVGILLQEEAVPVRAAVRGACELLGLDPLYVANEGKLLAIVPAVDEEAALAAMRSHPLGRDARVIGQVVAEPSPLVLMRTCMGGTRMIDMLVGDHLPRIC